MIAVVIWRGNFTTVQLMDVLMYYGDTTKQMLISQQQTMEHQHKCERYVIVTISCSYDCHN